MKNFLLKNRKAKMERRRRKSALGDYLDTLDEPPDRKQQRAAFYTSLRQFYRHKWNCPLKLPRVQGVDFDLFKLYETVTALGGWQKVSFDDRWAQVSTAMSFENDVAVAQHAFKVIYMRYLSKYEQSELAGEADEHDMEMLSGSRSRGKGYSSMGGSECPVAMPRNEGAYEHFRARESRRIQQENVYDRLIKSLLSGLPNEVDFAVNVLTLLSHPGPRMLKLFQAPQLISILMAHVAIYSDGACSLEDLHDGCWKTQLGDFKAFWQGAGIDDVEIHSLLGVCTTSRFSLEDAELFTGLELEYDQKDPVSWRIFQIASIMRNLSFEHINKSAMAHCWPLMKFLFVCINCKWIVLRNIALDTLSNLASEIDLSEESEISVHLLMRTITQCLNSTDKLELIRGLETLAGLCNIDRNESFLCELLSRPLLARIFSVVAVKDIMLCVYTLECLYQISELGSVACDQLSAHSHGIDQLVSLTTVEAVSFGPSGLVGMKVVEFHGPPQLAPPPPPNLAPSSLIPSTPHLVPINRPSVSFVQPQTPLLVTTPTSSRIPPPKIPPSTAQVAVNGVENTSTAQVAVNGVENTSETLTRQWLRNNCVQEPGASTSRGELYSVYVDDLRTSFPLSVTAFTSTLRSMFPSATLVSYGENSSQMTVEGVKMINRQTFAGSNASLSTTVAPCASTSGNAVAAAHPLVQQMLLTGSSSSGRNQPLPNNNNNSNHAQPVAVNCSAPSTMEMNGNASGSTTPDSQHLDEPKNRQTLRKAPRTSITLPSGNQVMLEVCEAAIEARDLIPDDGRHEARIVRVENTAIVRDVTNSGDALEGVKVAMPRRLNGMVNTEFSSGEEDKQKTNGGVRSDEHSSNQDEQFALNVDQCQSSMEKVLTSSSMLNGNHLSQQSNGELTPTTSPSIVPSGFRRKPRPISQSASLPQCNGPIASSSSVAMMDQHDDHSPMAKRRRISGPHQPAGHRSRQQSMATDESSEPSTSRPTSRESSIASARSRPLSREEGTSSSLMTHNSGEYLCEWAECGRFFASSSAMLWHSANEHVDEQTIQCKWPRCDATIRAKWSLVTHLQDHHCSENALRAAAARRLENPSLPVMAMEPREPAPQHPGYSKHAAIEAIRRHAFNFLTREITDENEGPVTKSIRLTSCLILRNLARYSSDGRRLLKRHERHLCWLALSRLESASALAQCLAELSTTPL